MSKVFLQLLVRYHVCKPIRKRRIFEPSLLLFELEVGIHREVEGIQPALDVQSI